MDTYELLRIQHEYSKFCTMREVMNLYTSDDIEYCNGILGAIPDIDIDKAKKEVLDLVGYNKNTGWFDKTAGEEWDYNMLDEIIMKYVGRKLYSE